MNVEIQILYQECQWIVYGHLKGVHTLQAQSQLNAQNPGIKGV